MIFLLVYSFFCKYILLHPLQRRGQKIFFGEGLSRRRAIKSSVNLLGIDDVDEGFWVDPVDGRDHRVNLFSADDRIEDLALRAFVTACAVQQSGVVVGQRANFAVNGARLARNDQQGRFLVALKKDLNHLRAGILVDNRVQGFVEAKKQACRPEYHDV